MNVNLVIHIQGSSITASSTIKYGFQLMGLIVEISDANFNFPNVGIPTSASGLK
jgi:hypothetical protein